MKSHCLKAIKLLVLTPVMVAAAVATAQVPAVTSYPTTARGNVVDTLHGEAIADPYRWLEDDNSTETKAWVKSQNETTEKVLSSLAKRGAIRERYKALYDFEKYSVPYREGPHYYWTRNDGLQQHSVVYYARRLTDKPKVALDPNTFSTDGTVSLAGFAPSPDGRFIAYGISSGGSDWNEWRVRDLATGKDLPEVLKWVKFSHASWTRDSRGFVYGRFDAPKPGAALTEANYFQKLHYHRIGTPQERDVLIYESRENKEWGFDGQFSADGRWLAVHVWRGAGRENGLVILPVNKGGKPESLVGKPVVISLTFDAQYTVLGNQGDRLFVRTDKDAPKGRILQIQVGQPAPANWKTLVSESAEPIDEASAVGGKLIVRYLKDVVSVVRTFTLTGQPSGEIALPGLGTAFGFTGKLTDRESFYSFTSMTQPGTLYRLDVATAKSTVFRAPKTVFESSQYETRRVFYTSRDGTRIPMFIAHRKGLMLDGENPTILYAYGGFSVISNPTFRVTAAAWLDQGGVYALANIRGGGEYGAAWHDAAKGVNRQKAFDDFIAASEWLTANGYAKPNRIGASGGSNGGLLVGVAINQKPEAFGAAVPEVGVMDMLRFHKFTIGWAWKGEYGDPEKREDFLALRAYSPLHNLAARRMPHVLIMTSDHDDRVVPAHSFKYAANLQALETGPALKLIRVQTRAGHGAGTPTSVIIAERGDVLTFFGATLGLGSKACAEPASHPCLRWQ
jgi:prolyl oligopeptidase